MKWLKKLNLAGVRTSSTAIFTFSKLLLDGCFLLGRDFKKFMILIMFGHMRKHGSETLSSTHLVAQKNSGYSEDCVTVT